jgi:hypothetical protein
MPAATVFTLVLLTITTTLVTASRFQARPDRSADALARWGLLYAVAVVVPWVWALYRSRTSADPRDAAAPVMTGQAVLVAALWATAPSADGGPFGLIGLALSAALLTAVGLIGRRIR